MIIRSEIEIAAAKQLAADLCCAPEDFFSAKNKVTAPVKSGNMRMFTDELPFFRAASMGMSTVICADESIRPFAELLAQSRTGTEIFSAAAAASINRELSAYGQCIGVLNEYYLPRTPYRPFIKRGGFETRIFEGSDIEQLYPLEGFSNALLHRAAGSRRDILAVCAVSGRTVMGIAGASLDSGSMAQIGIDVLDGCRGMGIGSVLTSICTAELFGMGYIPYYGTWSGNILSKRLAVHCGFFPAWTEMFSVKTDIKQ